MNKEVTSTHEDLQNKRSNIIHAERALDGLIGMYVWENNGIYKVGNQLSEAALSERRSLIVQYLDSFSDDTFEYKGDKETIIGMLRNRLLENKTYKQIGDEYQVSEHIVRNKTRNAIRRFIDRNLREHLIQFRPYNEHHIPRLAWDVTCEFDIKKLFGLKPGDYSERATTLQDTILADLKLKDLKFSDKFRTESFDIGNPEHIDRTYNIPVLYVIRGIYQYHHREKYGFVEAFKQLKVDLQV